MSEVNDVDNDHRFIREGRPLRAWLPELLGPEPATRRRAENAVSAMYWGAPVADASAYQHFPRDLPAHRDAFAAAVAAVVNDPAFPGEAFVRAAIKLIKDDRRRSHELHEMEERLLEFDEPLGPAEKEALLEQIKRGHFEEKSGQLANSSGTHTLHVVTGCVGAVLLRMPDVVRAGLRDRDVCLAIADALKKIGPAAAVFAPDLLSPDQLSAQEYGIPFPQTLAAVAREDVATVRALLDRLRSDDPRVGFAAAQTLSLIGPQAARIVPSLPDDLLALLDRSDRGDVVLTCIAAVAPDRRDVFERVLAAARPAPPDMRTVEGFGDYQYDAAMSRRGVAIEALAHCRMFAREAVPVLVESLKSFKEYDPDWTYENGAHGRVVNTLSRLGPDAAAAVPALITRIRDSEGDVDWRVIRYFGEIGPAASAALPALQRLREEISEGPNDGGATGAAPDPATDPLPWAIARVNGRIP